MAELSWNDTLEVGIPEIDADHRAMMTTVNRLHDSLLARGDRAEGQRQLRTLIQQVRSHFDRELVLMENRAPGFIETHAAHYQNLIAELEEDYQSLLQNGYLGTEDMLVRQIEGLLVLTVTRFCSRLKADDQA